MYDVAIIGAGPAGLFASYELITKNKNFLLTNAFQYKFKKNDINIFNGDKFVHAAIEDNSSRVPEEVELFMDEEKMNEGNGTKYTVKRGQSLLYNVFKIWRELSLLENSMLLNRITKSSIVRVIGVEIGDMPKEDVRGYLQGIKELMEQKSAINIPLLSQQLLYSSHSLHGFLKEDFIISKRLPNTSICLIFIFPIVITPWCQMARHQ